MVTGSGATVVRAGLDDPARPQARAERGLLVGLLGGAGAVFSHQMAGGHAGPVVAIVVTVLAAGCGVAVTRWRVGFATALGVALAGQGASHVLMLGSGVHADAMAMGQSGLGEQTHHMHEMAGAGSPSGGLSMLLAHAAVALVTALAIRGADRVVLELLRTLVNWFLPRTWLPRAPLARHRFARISDQRMLPCRTRTTTPLTRRGPPVLTRLSFFTP